MEAKGKDDRKKDTPRGCVRGEGRRKDAAMRRGRKRVEEDIQERIEGESNLLRRTHTRSLSFFVRLSLPPWLVHYTYTARTHTMSLVSEHLYIAPLALSLSTVGETLSLSCSSMSARLHPTSHTRPPPPSPPPPPPPSGSGYDPRIAVFWWHTNPGVGSAYTSESVV